MKTASHVSVRWCGVSIGAYTLADIQVKHCRLQCLKFSTSWYDGSPHGAYAPDLSLVKQPLGTLAKILQI